MSRLNNTRILRSSPSSSESFDISDKRSGWRQEEDRPHINANNKNSVNLQFDIKAGRGFTELMISIPQEDIPQMLEEIAKALPNAKELFTKYSSIASELHNKHKEKMGYA